MSLINIINNTNKYVIIKLLIAKHIVTNKLNI